MTTFATPAPRRSWPLFVSALIPLYQPLIALVAARPAPAITLLIALGLGAFLICWFRAFGLTGHSLDRRWNLAGLVISLLLYGLCLPVIGLGGLAFALYGSLFAGYQGSGVFKWTGTALVGLAILLPELTGLTPAGYAWPFLIVAVLCAEVSGQWYHHLVLARELRRLKRERETLVRDAERERIAQDLHDRLGQALNIVVLRSSLAVRLAKSAPEQAIQEMGAVEETARQALSEVRAAVQGYRGAGLQAELSRAKVALDVAGVDLQIRREQRWLPAAVEQVMGLLIREAVTNILRHSDARHCRITVRQKQHTAELEVLDDGHVTSTPEPGQGLSGMLERVRTLGGTLSWEVRGGFRILATFPVAEDA